MNSPRISPTTPTTIRIQPTVCRSTPATVAVTANARIAPTAIRKRLPPIVMASGGPARRRERVLQALFRRVVERGLDHAARNLDLVEHLVERDVADERDDGRVARRELLAELLHEVVVDARVAERARGRAGRRADRYAEQRHEEDQADEAAPQRAAGGAAARQRRLVELDLAVVSPFDDHEVVELDLVARLEPAHVGDDLLGGGKIGIGDRYELAHGAPLDGSPARILRRR